MIVVELLDGQPELRLVELLLPSRLLLSGTLKDLIVLLICRAGVHRLELEAVFHVGDGCGSERVKLLIEMTRSHLRVLFLTDVSGLQPGILLLHPLNLAHCMFPSLLGEDCHPLALAEGDRHLLSPLTGVCHLGGHEGSLLGLLSDLDLP